MSRKKGTDNVYTINHLILANEVLLIGLVWQTVSVLKKIDIHPWKANFFQVIEGIEIYKKRLEAIFACVNFTIRKNLDLYLFYKNMSINFSYLKPFFSISGNYKVSCTIIHTIKSKLYWSQSTHLKRLFLITITICKSFSSFEG